MIQLVEEMRSKGLDVKSVELDGKLKRVFTENKKKKNGWYVGWINRTEHGGELICCVYGDWASGNQYTYKSRIPLSGKEDRALKTKINNAKKEFIQAKEKESEMAAEISRKNWDFARPIADSGYLRNKCISGLHGAKTIIGVDGKRDICVPCRDVSGKIWGLQYIRENGQKVFTAGQKSMGTFFQIGDLSDTFYLVEGFATACSVHEATGKTVFAAFFASNLPVVAETLYKAYPTKKFIVCGDNDVWTEGNPGKLKAEQAAKACLGMTLLPDFKDVQTRPTDWNDLHCLEGLDVVRSQLSLETQESYVMPLGMSDRCAFFMSSKSKQIQAISSGADVEFLRLMPIAFWEARYPGVKTRVDWLQAKSDMLEQAMMKGKFCAGDLRGSGAWADSGKVIINLGDRLLVDGVYRDYSKIKSRCTYQLGKTIPRPPQRILSASEGVQLASMFHHLKWQHKSSSAYLLGWIGLSYICGTLPIRPNVWVTGPSSAGKSTVLQQMVMPLIGKYVNAFQGGTTEAGIRQTIKSDALAMVYDEFERTSQYSAERIDMIVELLRQCWSETEGKVIKGSSSQQSVHYQVRTMALVSSIRVSLDNDADRSRFTLLELENHKNDHEHYERLVQMLPLLTDDFCASLAARMFAKVDVVLKNFAVWKNVLAKEFNLRFADQHGMLLAGYCAVTQDEIVTKDQAKNILIQLNISSAGFEEEESDEYECINHLLNRQVKILNAMGRVQSVSIGTILERSQSDEKAQLRDFGLLVRGKHLFVANRHPELFLLFSDTKWQKDWKTSLLRVPGAEKDAPQWFGTMGRSQRCVRFSLSSLLSGR